MRAIVAGAFLRRLARTFLALSGAGVGSLLLVAGATQALATAEITVAVRTSLLTATEGQPLGTAAVPVVLGHFNDTGGVFTDCSPTCTTSCTKFSSDYNVTVDWGDGTPSDNNAAGGKITLGNRTNFCDFTLRGYHTYSLFAEGTHTVTITVTDTTDTVPVTASGTGTITVGSDADLVVQGAGTIHATAGQDTGSQIVAIMIDSAGSTRLPTDYSVSINWGDGTSLDTSTGSVAADLRNVSGHHTYAIRYPSPNTYTILVAVRDNVDGHGDGDPDSTPTPANVLDAALHFTGATVSVPDGMFSGTVGTFTDDDPSGVVGEYTVTIDWGDGSSSAGGVSAGLGHFNATGTHTYTSRGQFTVTVTVAETGGASTSGTSTLVVQLPAAVFPALSNGAYGGYVTAATIQNVGSSPAVVHIAYFDQNGAPVGAGDSISSLPVNASWTVRQDNGNSFPNSGGNAAQAGSAVVYSSQPIASFVNEFAPGNVGDATSYSGVQVPSGVGTTLYAPTIVNNAYGAYTTGIGLLNQGSSPTDVSITYRDGGGAVVKTQTVSGLAAHAYQAFYSGDAVLNLPSGFIGSATITSSTSQPLGAVVNETGPGGQFSSYDAVPSGSPLLNAPVALNNAFGGFYTGMAIQNTSATGGMVSVTYYDVSGTATAKSFPIAANGSLGVYQGSLTDGPAPGAYTAVIQSSTVPLAAIVNETGPAGAGSARQSTSYNTFSAGSAALHLPLVENAGTDPWNTGEGIMNTGTGSTTVTVTYYNSVTGTAIGATQSMVLAPQAFWGLYQPGGGLPLGTRATAVVTTSAGGQVAVICNENSPTTFMSYDGQ